MKTLLEKESYFAELDGRDEAANQLAKAYSTAMNSKQREQAILNIMENDKATVALVVTLIPSYLHHQIIWDICKRVLPDD